MHTALIGHTGFVGSNIYDQFPFDDVYNSQTIAGIEGKEYDLVVSAANRAEMWRINQEPDKDAAEIQEFIEHIKTVKIKKFVLISTVGVYKNPNGANEDTEIETEGLTPYGKNRYFLEQYVRDHFDATIIRLPGLIGKGLKKNVIYDLLHENNVDRIHSEGVYQYYDLSNIWHDIQVALDNNLSLVNFASPPVSTADVVRECFHKEFMNSPDDIVPAYWDMHTKYAALYHSSGNYLYSKEQEIEQIASFVASQK